MGGLVDKPLRETEYFVAWLLFFLLASVIGGLAGGFAGFIVGAVLGASGTDPSVIALASGVVGFILGVPISYASFRIIVGSMVVKKLAARYGTQVSPPVAPAIPYPATGQDEAGVSAGG